MHPTNHYCHCCSLQGYWLWQRLLYIIIGIMLLSAGAAAYAVRSSGRQGTWAWPQRVLRAVCFLFFDVCYVGVLSIIFMGIDCQLVNIPNTSALRMRDAKYVGKWPMQPCERGGRLRVQPARCARPDVEVVDSVHCILLPKRLSSRMLTTGVRCRPAPQSALRCRTWRRPA